MTPSDTFKTILKPSEEVLFKDRNSKFYGFAFPVTTEEQIMTYIAEVKNQHHSARHWCYAYRIGTKDMAYRVHDDGEPKNSAGMPIYGQIQSFDVTDVLVLVVRYFGGTKLGVGGLVNAYRTSAQMALEASKIVKKTINRKLHVSCTYDHLDKVMRIIKEKKLKITDQQMHLDCEITIEVRLRDAEIIFGRLSQLNSSVVNYI